MGAPQILTTFFDWCPRGSSTALQVHEPRQEQASHLEDFVPKSLPELQLTGYKATPVISCKGIFAKPFFCNS